MSRVAILACGTSIAKFPGRGGGTQQRAFDEVWALNGMAFWPTYEDIDRLYVMDDLLCRLPYYNDPELAESLKTYKKRIITSKQYDDWPTSEAFPVKECVKEFGMPLGIAMYSTPDWMIAHAIMDGFTEIDLFGVDNQEKAAFEMRSSTAMWIGVAQGRGVRVTTYAGSYHQYFTSPAVAMEFGIYGYAFRPRIETLIFEPEELEDKT